MVGVNIGRIEYEFKGFSIFEFKTLKSNVFISFYTAKQKEYFTIYFYEKSYNDAVFSMIQDYDIWFKEKKVSRLIKKIYVSKPIEQLKQTVKQLNTIQGMKIKLPIIRPILTLKKQFQGSLMVEKL